MHELVQKAQSFVDGHLGEFTPWLFLAVGVLMLLLGAHWLVLGSVTMARRMGISVLVVGLTVVAFGTSAPELAFNVNAAWNHNDDLSFGNIIGSNIANIGLVLGLCALCAPLAVHGRVIRKEIPWMIAISFGAWALTLVPLNYLDPGHPAGEGFGRVAGAALLGAFGVFLLSWYLMARRDARDPLTQESLESTRQATLKSGYLAMFLFVLGALLLWNGAVVSEVGAIDLAQRAGMTDALIGLTVVAVATSLPELITSLVALRSGHTDLAIGNVVGSNVFNLALVLGATAVIAPVNLPAPFVTLGEMKLPVAPLHLAFMCGIALLLWPLAFTQRRIGRWEGLLLLVLYLGYMTMNVVLDDRKTQTPKRQTPTAQSASL